MKKLIQSTALIIFFTLSLLAGWMWRGVYYDTICRSVHDTTTISVVERFKGDYHLDGYAKQSEYATCNYTLIKN